jgi:hypothetical protein
MTQQGPYFFFLLLSTIPTAVAYKFLSRDKVVSSVITNCTELTPLDNTPCQAVLKCILTNTSADYSARWSAGASILAFIPTVVGLMSNSIDEVVLCAEESTLVAVMLSLCTVSTFTSRFGDRQSSLRLNKETVLESLKSQLTELDFEDRNTRVTGRRTFERKVLIIIAVALLVACSVAVWYSIYQITLYGVIIFSCPLRIHIPLWAGLSQLISILSIWLRKYTIRTTVVALYPSHRLTTMITSHSKDFRQLLGGNDTGLFPHKLILRSSYNTPASQIIRLVVAILSFSLYAFGTVVLGSMTMFAASDAVRVMVLIAASAGVGRLIGTWISAPSGTWKKCMAVDVPLAHHEWLKEQISDGIDTDGGMELRLLSNREILCNSSQILK